MQCAPLCNTLIGRVQHSVTNLVQRVGKVRKPLHGGTRRVYPHHPGKEPRGGTHRAAAITTAHVSWWLLKTKAETSEGKGRVPDAVKRLGGVAGFNTRVVSPGW